MCGTPGVQLRSALGQKPPSLPPIRIPNHHCGSDIGVNSPCHLPGRSVRIGSWQPVEPTTCVAREFARRRQLTPSESSGRGCAPGRAGTCTLSRHFTVLTIMLCRREKRIVRVVERKEYDLPAKYDSFASMQADPARCVLPPARRMSALLTRNGIDTHSVLNMLHLMRQMR